MAFLPRKDRHYLSSRELAFREVVAGSTNGLVLPEFKLPDGHFDRATTSLLIVLPGGYPDLPPDMFYVSPWIKLATTQRYARCADQSFQFNGEQWQQWSRHNNEWRRGVDGIWTMLKRVEHALAEAK
jgi:hypothetical protein